MLEIKDLTVRIAGKPVLHGLHLTAKSGVITGIVGKSGSGKSTLFKVILGVPALVSQFEISGEILWNGRPLSDASHKPIQPVFQDPFTFFSPFISIRKSILEPFYIREGFFASKDKLEQEMDRIEELFSRFHLKKDILDKKINQLSGGQLQRLAILRAILANPEFLLLDEPVTALDALVQAEIIHLILELNKTQNLGFILVSHDLGLVKNLCEDLFILNEGKIIESGKTKDIFEKPKLDFTRNLIQSRDLSAI